MKDIHDRINAVELLGPAVYTDDNVPIAVDLEDFEAAEIVRYIGGKRYLKLLADFGGTHATGTALSATLVKGRPHYAS